MGCPTGLSAMGEVVALARHGGSRFLFFVTMAMAIEPWTVSGLLACVVVTCSTHSLVVTVMVNCKYDLFRQCVFLGRRCICICPTHFGKYRHTCDSSRQTPEGRRAAAISESQ